MNLYAYDLHGEKKEGRGFGVEGVASVKAEVGTQCDIVKSSQVPLVKETGPGGIYVVL